MFLCIIYKNLSGRVPSFVVKYDKNDDENMRFYDCFVQSVWQIVKSDKI